MRHSIFFFVFFTEDKCIIIQHGSTLFIISSRLISKSKGKGRDGMIRPGSEELVER